MRCKIEWYSVQEGPPYYVNAPMRDVSRCATHQWHDMPAITQNLPGGQTGLCPIGRIEEATDAALARIAAAK